MTVEPAAEEESGWTQVKQTPKRSNGNSTWNECLHPLQRTKKWRAEFIVNRSDRGKQWLIDIAMTQLLAPFFEKDKNTTVMCQDKTEIHNINQLNKEMNKRLQNVVQTTETRDRKVVVFSIQYPGGLHNAKKDKEMLQHLKENKVFLNEHTTTEMIFEQVGFFIELDPNTVYRPDLMDTLKQTLEQHIKDHPQDMRDPFSPTNIEPKTPYFEIRKGIEAQFLKSDTDSKVKTTIKAEVIQVWTEVSSAEIMRKLLTKADLYYSYVGQFIPKKRGAKLYTIEKYINAIKKQLIYKAEISSIMIQYLAEEAMSEEVKEFFLDGATNTLDNHLLSMEHVLRIEPTNESATKGKWLIICRKEKREQVRADLISNLHQYYRRSVIYETVQNKFHTPIPIVAPPRYNYSEYIESIIPESMSQQNETDTPETVYRRSISANRNKRGPPLPTITTTSKCESTNEDSPYLKALTSSRRPKTREDEKPTKPNDKNNILSRYTGADSIGTKNSSLSRDTALSVLTSEVDNLVSELNAAGKEIKDSRKEIEDSKTIISQLIKENREMKARHLRAEEIHNKTENMFQQFMISMNMQLLQNNSTGGGTSSHNNTVTSVPKAMTKESNSNQRIETTPKNPHAQREDEQVFHSAAEYHETQLREPPDIRPVQLYQQLVEEEISFSRVEEVEEPNPLAGNQMEDDNNNYHVTSASQHTLEDEY